MTVGKNTGMGNGMTAAAAVPLLLLLVLLVFDGRYESIPIPLRIPRIQFKSWNTTKAAPVVSKLFCRFTVKSGEERKPERRLNAGITRRRKIVSRPGMLGGRVGE